MKKDVRAALASIVEQHGLEAVSRTLHELEAAHKSEASATPDRSNRTRRQRRHRPSRGHQRRRSAIDYINGLELPGERELIVRRAAEEFDRRTFLPTLGDVRVFWETYGIEEPTPTSRTNGIGRLFKFLVTLGTAEVERILDDRLFSGPAKLGPIAVAIRETTTGAKLFRVSELVKQYDENWKGSSEWARMPHTDAHAKRLVRSIQVHHRGVTLITDQKPVGSGVLVKGAKGYGILTAGHVCTLLKEEIGRGHSLSYVSQGMRDARPPNSPVPLDIRRLQPLRMPSVYTKGRPLPDYGCIVLQSVDAASMNAWCSFVNITRDGPSRTQKEYALTHNAWLAAGFVDELRPYATSVFVQYFIGGPEAVYERDGRRYLLVRDQCANQALPKSLGGMSGSGLWEVPVEGRKDDLDADRLEIGTPILRGITFLQELQHSDEPKAFYAHELEAIADEVVGWLDEP